MDRLTERIQQTRESLVTFREVLAMDPSVIIRDAAIKRFEYTMEMTWKTAQLYLRTHDGLDLASPKAVTRACFQTELLDEKETSLAILMLDDRNLTTHTYNEKLAESIYKKLNGYCKLLTKWIDAIEEKIP